MDFFLERPGERMEQYLGLWKRYSIQHVCAIYSYQLPRSANTKPISLNVSTVKLA